MSIRDLFTINRKKNNGIIIDQSREKAFPEGIVDKMSTM